MGLATFSDNICIFLWFQAHLHPCLQFLKALFHWGFLTHQIHVSENMFSSNFVMGQNSKSPSSFGFPIVLVDQQPSSETPSIRFVQSWEKRFCLWVWYKDITSFSSSSHAHNMVTIWDKGKLHWLQLKSDSQDVSYCILADQHQICPNLEGGVGGARPALAPMAWWQSRFTIIPPFHLLLVRFVLCVVKITFFGFFSSFAWIEWRSCENKLVDKISIDMMATDNPQELLDIFCFIFIFISISFFNFQVVDDIFSHHSTFPWI